MTNVLLQIQNITKTYKVTNKTINALKGVSLDIYNGEVLGLLGVNGAGLILDYILTVAVSVASGSTVIAKVPASTPCGSVETTMLARPLLSGRKVPAGIGTAPAPGGISHSS